MRGSDRHLPRCSRNPSTSSRMTVRRRHLESALQQLEERGLARQLDGCWYLTEAGHVAVEAQKRAQRRKASRAAAMRGFLRHCAGRERRAA